MRPPPYRKDGSPSSGLQPFPRQTSADHMHNNASQREGGLCGSEPDPPLPRNRLAVDVLGGELAVLKRVALDALLLALLAGIAHRLADAEGHEGDVGQMVIGDVVKAAR